MGRRDDDFVMDDCPGPELRNQVIYPLARSTEHRSGKVLAAGPVHAEHLSGIAASHERTERSEVVTRHEFRIRANTERDPCRDSLF